MADSMVDTTADSSQRVFSKSFTQQEGLSETAIANAVEVMRSGRLHRYNTLGDELAEAALLEREFAELLGVPYCLACASGGYAIHIALKAAGLKPGDGVLTNAFTLAPVPGAINNAGGKVVLVEIDANYCVDLTHLASQMAQTGCRFFVLSHMRGHIADMDAIVDLCEQHDVTLIEDCAHTMGASWRGKPSGSFGKVACFSTQTYKHINSGEGGLLTTDDPDISARAIIYSGSYMLFERHGSRPDTAQFSDIKLDTPNYSGRMDNLRATILRAQLPQLADNVARWNSRYQEISATLATNPNIILSERPAHEEFVGSSIQFRLRGAKAELMPSFIANCLARGVELKWFGEAQPNGFTSRFDSWRYLGAAPSLPNTLNILATTCDMRIPLTFDCADMRQLGEIINQETNALLA